MKKLGQSIITGVSGPALTEEEILFIEEENIGGVILFSHNYESPAQLAELINSIQVLRDEYPLFITVDQEGGRVQRFKNGFTLIPSMGKITSKKSPKLVFEIHQQISKELKACGINVDFSPCCDVLLNDSNKVIGDRSFGKEGEEVGRYITAAIRGLQSNGILACAKHFPGHGSTQKDSHFDLPYVKTSKEELEQNEIIPFKRAAKSRIEMIMMAHLVYDCIDETLPTSLSKLAYDYLREVCRYQKLIVTDDMEMKAITNKFSHGESAVKAYLAGADLLIYRTFEGGKQALMGLKEGLKNKEIPSQLVNEHYERILETKKSHFSQYRPVYIPEIISEMKLAEGKKILDEHFPS